MSSPRANERIEEVSSYGNLKQVIDACVTFYHSTLGSNKDRADTSTRRRQLASWIRKFHQDSGTLTPSVEKAIARLHEEPCLVIMTAHQPNLFAYSGVMRKATLDYVLARKLSELLNLPAVSFFGIADQDFTDDRWVKSALVPDVERRGGVLELRLALPEKMMLNKVGKPSRAILDDWRNEIERWIERKLNAINRLGRVPGLKSNENRVHSQNLEGFWKIVEEAAEKAQALSDFSAFIMSKVVNGMWEYDTLFCRFSECQRIFEQEFSVLLSRFEEYSRYVQEATLHSPEPDKGVYEQESATLPFWLHCDCGSKARLMATKEGEVLKGSGKCLRCLSEYRMDFSLQKEPMLKEILDRISARSIVMPLIFFNGLKVCCYIGGAGGKEYLDQAKYVAEKMKLPYPPVVIWRPRDIYLGLGQLEAFMIFRNLSGISDLSQHSAVKTSFAEKISDIQHQIDELQSRKEQLPDTLKGDLRAKEIKRLADEQAEIRRRANFPVLMRNLVLLENVGSVLQLYPSIIDYAVNLGLRNVSERWMNSLEKNDDLSSNIKLRTSFEVDLPTQLCDSLSEMK